MSHRINSLLSGVSRTALGAAFAMTLLVAPAAAGEPKAFNIPVQEATTAIRAFGQQAGIQVLATVDDLRGKRVNAVVGKLDVQDALRQMLVGTGLTFRATDANTILIEKPRAAAYAAPETTAQAPAAQPTDAPKDQPPEDDKKAEDDRKVERVVVTGSHIRGKHPKSSPLETYTRKDIERSGATTTEQFIQKLPQNMGTRTQFTPGATSAGEGNQSENRTGIAGVDLRGLGVGTTLVLLNGHRMAAGDRGQAVDISMIPVGAIERVEVLTDGASAIYGSDAIGGVVNFVLRKDFDGAETRIAGGGVTSGGLRQGDFSQTVGRAWGSGHGLVSYNFFSASALKATDRDYSAAAERELLTPSSQRHSLLAAFSQDIGERIELSGDFAYTTRDTKTVSTGTTDPNPLNHRVITQQNDTEQFFGNLSLDYRLSDTLTATLATTYSNVDTSGRLVQLLYKRTPPTVSSDRAVSQESSLLDVTASLDGSLFALPAGRVRFSLGGGALTEEYSGETTAGITVTQGTLGRRTTYAFGELFVPLIGEEQNIPLVERLELSLAARYTDYSDESDPRLPREFGDSTDPKIGLLWAPFEALNLRATYGTSFRAPSLLQIDQTAAFNRMAITTHIPFPSGPLATTLTVSDYAVPDLGPELAETYTAGFDFRPGFLRGIELSATYYNISYTDRIGAPIGGAAPLMNPELFPDVIYRPPSIEFVENIFRTTPNLGNPLNLNLADPHAAAVAFFNSPNAWIRDSRIRNLALSEQDGFDASVRYETETALGDIRLGAAVTGIASYRQQITATSPVVSVVDTVARPVDMRGRVFAGFSRGGFDADVTVNYVDDYRNPFVTPPQKVDSWTTVDLRLSYDFGESAGFLDGLRMDVSAQNLFDRDPPAVGRSPGIGGISQPIGFDPANANPLGRFVVLGLSKRW